MLALGDASHTSKVLPRTLQPTWDERCELLVRDPATQRLSIRVVDKDYVTSDDALGSTLLPLATLEPGKRRQLNLQLVGGGDGRVQLQVELVPLEGACACTRAWPAIFLAGLHVEPHTLRHPVAPPCARADMATSAEEMVGGLQGTLPHASDVPRPWRLLAQLSGAAGLEHLEPVAFIDNTDTDTQVCVCGNERKTGGE